MRQSSSIDRGPGAWLAACAVFVVFFGVLVAPGQAGLIVIQDAGDDYIAFEAESYRFIDDLDGDGTGWTPQADATASGGVYLHGYDSSGNVPEESEAVYNLIFSTPGTYRLYVRHRSTVPSSVGQDSFFRPADFNSPADVTAGTNNRDDVDFSYAWGYFGSYSVDDPADLLTGLEFRIGIREPEMHLDRIVLTRTDYGGSVFIPLASAGDLEALANSTAAVPEPSSIVLCLSGVAALAALGWRRRRRRPAIR